MVYIREGGVLMDGQTIALLVIADILLIVVLIAISRGAYNKLKTNLSFDELTKLPLKEKFQELYEKEITSIGDNKYAIVVMDIGGFKLVNEMFGRNEGDKLLIYVSNLLRKNVGSNIVSRINDDNFVFGYMYKDFDNLKFVMEQITTELEKYQGKIHPFAYFGICDITDTKTDLDVLCDHADLALETVKGSMITNYAVYTEQTRAKMLKDKKMENEMLSALDDHQFVVYFQPKYDIQTSKPIGAEALVRWKHPEEGLIPPNDFIPLFERDGLIIKLDEYVWEETCRKIREWLDNGYDVVPVSVNVSRVHIFNEKLRKIIFDITDKYKIPHELLELEITESAFLDNTKQLYSAMDYFRNNGFTVSMDDFGSGYSSLNMLKDGNVDIVKIDKEFLNETVATDKGKAIIASAINMVRELNMEVIAEGVENAEQAKFLLGIGCNMAQGFYYSKPIDSEEFENKIFKGEK